MRAALLAILLVPAAARAYPQFQLSTGAVRCNQCHFAPAGGGLINAYGRDEAGDTISRGGDGRFLHGLWEPPAWLALGGDLRLAGTLEYEGQDNGFGADYGVFPMQADLYARVAAGGLSIYVNFGYNDSIRPEARVPWSARFQSREHYIMWREGTTGWYVRAGRFFAPYGLRLPEHTAYIRRFIGFNILEETYNLSGGYIDDDMELHVTAFTPDFIRDAVGERGSGGAAYFERRFGQIAAAGAQARVSVGDTNTKSQVGAVGKLWLDGPRIQLLAEADLIYQLLRNLGPNRSQFAGYLGAAWFPFRGFLAQLMLERFDEDLAIKGVARDAVDIELQWFPTAHVEISLYGRLQIIGTGSSDGSPSEVGLLQIHYYL
jgi:hypothetical protein